MANLIYRLRLWVLELSIPIQKVMQKLHPPEALTNFETAVALTIKMRDGDVLLSRERWHFTNLFIPGYWSHAAIYGDGMVIEAIGTGVQMVAFEDWITKKHSWCILRPAGDGMSAWSKAFEALGDGYDYTFGSAAKAFYCSGLVKFAWSWSWAKGTITPENIYQASRMGEFIQIIEEHRDA